MSKYKAKWPNQAGGNEPCTYSSHPLTCSSSTVPRRKPQCRRQQQQQGCLAPTSETQGGEAAKCSHKSAFSQGCSQCSPHFAPVRPNHQTQPRPLYHSAADGEQEARAHLQQPASACRPQGQSLILATRNSDQSTTYNKLCPHKIGGFFETISTIGKTWFKIWNPLGISVANARKNKSFSPSSTGDVLGCEAFSPNFWSPQLSEPSALQNASSHSKHPMCLSKGARHSAAWVKDIALPASCWQSRPESPLNFSLGTLYPIIPKWALGCSRRPLKSNWPCFPAMHASLVLVVTIPHEPSEDVLPLLRLCEMSAMHRASLETGKASNRAA